MTKNIVSTVEQLEKFVSLSKKKKYEIEKIIKCQPMLINQYYLELIDWENKTDPIYKMVVPSTQETDSEGFFDTSGEFDNTKIQGLQHKYSQTALILTTNRCTTYCRHCFRKRLAGIVTHEIVNDWNLVIEYIKNHKEITNILLSGGDPLTLSMDYLKIILDKLSTIKHLRFVRIGTHIPVVDPDRITKNDELLRIFGSFKNKKQIYIVTQFNHPIEITPKTIKMAKTLKKLGIIINNQTVLLKGVNDNHKTMAQLQSKLTKIGIIPYYIFQCRPVKKVKNIFQVPLAKAVEIISQTKSSLDGLSKRFRFVMSHETGKIEILGKKENEFYFKYHQVKDKNLSEKIFSKKLSKKDCWLDI